jgi:hypothetical protein
MEQRTPVDRWAIVMLIAFVLAYCAVVGYRGVAFW